MDAHRHVVADLLFAAGDDYMGAAFRQNPGRGLAQSSASMVACMRRMPLSEIAAAGDNAVTVLADQPIDQFLSMTAQSAQRTFFILADQPGIARNVCGHDRQRSAPSRLTRRMMQVTGAAKKSDKPDH